MNVQSCIFNTQHEFIIWVVMTSVRNNIVPYVGPSSGTTLAR